MSRVLKILAILGASVVLLILIIYSVWLFGIVTFFASVFVFGPIERDRNIHEVSFYARRALSSSFKKWLNRCGIAETLGRSAFLCFLSIFTFSGTNHSRIFWLGAAFATSITIGYLLLRNIQEHLDIDVTRWAYFKVSLILGSFFSFLISWIPGSNLAEIVTQTAKSKWWKKLEFNEVVELLYGLSFHVNELIAGFFNELLGDMIGYVVSSIISLNVVYGFLIALYSILLVRVINMFTAKDPSAIEPMA